MLAMASSHLTPEKLAFLLDFSPRVKSELSQNNLSKNGRGTAAYHAMEALIQRKMLRSSLAKDLLTCLYLAISRAKL